MKPPPGFESRPFRHCERKAFRPVNAVWSSEICPITVGSQHFPGVLRRVEDVPPWTEGPASTSWNSKAVTISEFPPPPRMAQNRSGFRSALTVSTSPPAVTTSAETRLSMVRPCLRICQPMTLPQASRLRGGHGDHHRLPNADASPPGSAGRSEGRTRKDVARRRPADLGARTSNVGRFLQHLREHPASGNR